MRSYTMPTTRLSTVSADNTLIDGIGPHVMSMIDVHVLESTLLQPLTMIWLIPRSVKAISTASVRLLDANEAWLALLLQ